MKHLFLITLFFFSLNSLAQSSSSENYSEKIDIEKQREIIEEISNEDFKKAIIYADSILLLKIPNKGRIYLDNGDLYLRVNKTQKAVDYFNKAIQLLKEENRPKDLAYAQLSLGQAYNSLNKKDEALKLVFEANTIAKKINDDDIEAYSFSVVSYIYYTSNNYAKAIQYSKKAAIIKLKQNDTLGLASRYNNIAVYYEKSEILDSSLIYHKKTLDLILASNEKLKVNQYRLAVSYNNIGKIAFKMENYKDAIANYKKSIKLHEKLQSNLANPYTNLAELYLNQKKLKESKTYYNQALEIAKETKDIKLLEKIYTPLLKISILQKDFENASLFQRKRDSLNLINISKENEEKIRLIDKQYQQSIKEEKLKQELEINKKNKIIFAILAGTLLFLGLFLIQKNKNSKLKLEQDKLVLEQKVLRTQMNPHFIFNALTSIQKTIFDDDHIKSASYLSRFAKLIRQNFEFVNKKEIYLTEDLDALKNYIEAQQLRFNNKFDYTINVDENINTSYIKIPPMLLQPFVENAIEHGLKPKTEKGNLEINIIKENDLICFKIIDDGIGLSKETKNKTREHAIDIFKKRLILRKLGEEKMFSLISTKDNPGTIVTFYLNLT